MSSEGQDRVDTLGWGRRPNRPKTFARNLTIPQKVPNVSIYDNGTGYFTWPDPGPCKCTSENFTSPRCEYPGEWLWAAPRVGSERDIERSSADVTMTDDERTAEENEMSLEGVMFYSTDPASDGYVLTPEGTTVRKPAADDD
jgi:hypothetical protein